jgi:hypothetical protein
LSYWAGFEMKKANRRRRKGRDLELFVQQIEQGLVGTNATVRSPDFIRDVHTGRRREVDVSVRQRVGSANLLVIFECRDRRKRQDATWIEQLASKRESVGADRVVAVSRVPFSAEAIKKAAAKGVDIRTIASIDAAAIRSWCSMTHLEVQNPHLEVSQAWVILAGDEPDPGLRFSLTEPVFDTSDGGTPLSIMSVVNRALSQNPDWAKAVPTDGSAVEKRLVIGFQGSGLFMNQTSPPRLVDRLVVVGSASIQTVQHALNGAFSYADGSGQVAQVADYPMGGPVPGMALRLIRDESNGQVGLYMVRAADEPS